MAQLMGQHDQVKHCQPGLLSSPFIREKVLFKMPSMKPTERLTGASVPWSAVFLY